MTLPPEPLPISGESITVIERFARDVVARATLSESTSLNAILPAVYDELRVLATYILRGERWARTMGPTALAHETYLKLIRETESKIQDRSHLLAVAATVMRRVLVDHVRARKAGKRGGGIAAVTLGESLLDEKGQGVDFLDLHRVLDSFAVEHPRKARIVEMVYFAGLTMEEAADVLGISERTALRDWRFAKAWLWRALSG